jgi:hypothetical protein
VRTVWGIEADLFEEFTLAIDQRRARAEKEGRNG